MTQQKDDLVSRAMSAQITRRKMLQGSLAMGASAVALGAFGGTFGISVQRAAASPLDSDLQILNYALTLELLEAAAYKAINDGNVLGNIYGGRAATYFRDFGAHEQAHVDTVRQTIIDLGGTPVTAPASGYNLSTVPTDAAGIVKFFQEVESVGASAYLGAAASIQNVAVLERALSIHAVEAEHASALAQLIAPGTSLFAPDAFARPRTPDPVFQIVAPFFTPKTSPFSDVSASTPYAEAIFYLAGLGIVRGQDGRFEPTSPLLRAQMAGLVARAFLWADEMYGNSRFEDQQVVDDDLWNSVNVLAYYNVARGISPTEFDPLAPVLHAQVISFVTRAMVAKGFWTPAQDSPMNQYANVPWESGHRLDIATYVERVGPVPATTNTMSNWTDYDKPAARAFSAEVVYRALLTIDKS